MTERGFGSRERAETEEWIDRSGSSGDLVREEKICRTRQVEIEQNKREEHNLIPSQTGQ